MPISSQDLQAIDDQYSQRFIQLDPAGYFIIYLDRDQGLICADHYSNEINEKGLATDPDTGEVIACSGGKAKRLPVKTYQGRTAKEIGIVLTEQGESPLTYLDHALYLGRELMKAEIALISGSDYIQD
ncbi:MAG: DUF4346 domain-containing protein [Synechococcaceae cyanobacterium RL_1_2]|nr:DUF4346 domain-containing protein [Synechococcaceae cyanobacterium RL_1_2]